MVKFDVEIIRVMVEMYIYGDVEGRNENIHSVLTKIYEDTREAEDYDYTKYEVKKILESFQPCESEEYYEKKIRAVRRVKTEKAALISAYYGLMFGLAWAENERLHYYE